MTRSNCYIKEILVSPHALLNLETALLKIRSSPQVSTATAISVGPKVWDALKIRLDYFARAELQAEWELWGEGGGKLWIKEMIRFCLNITSYSF